MRRAFQRLSVVERSVWPVIEIKRPAKNGPAFFAELANRGFRRPAPWTKDASAHFADQAACRCCRARYSMVTLPMFESIQLAMRSSSLNDISSGALALSMPAAGQSARSDL